MNWRLRFTSRLATAVTTQLPELKIAFQFFRAMPAVLNIPNRSLFIKLIVILLVLVLLLEFLIFDYEDDDEDESSRRLFDPFQNHVGDVRFAADGGRIPDEFGVFLRRIAPRRPAGGQALLDDPSRLAEQNRNVFLRVQPIADEKWHHHQVFRFRQRITISDARRLFEKNPVDAGINFPGAD